MVQCAGIEQRPGGIIQVGHDDVRRHTDAVRNRCRFGGAIAGSAIVNSAIAGSAKIGHGCSVLAGGALERRLHLGEEALVGRSHVLATQLCEAAQQVGFVGVEVIWRFDLDDDDQVPTTPPTQMRHATALQTEAVAGLRPLRDDHVLPAVERLEWQLHTERCLRDPDRQVLDQVVALPLEPLVRRHSKVHVQVARRPATWSDRTATRQTQRGAVVDASRHVDGVGAFTDDATLTGAARARRLDPLTGSTAGATGR